jgi:chromate transporter
MTLLELAAAVFLYNVLTFGNGPAMIPLLQENLVDGRGVISSDQLLYAFAIARVVPGQANVYVAAIGTMLFGLPGAVLATLAIQLPGYLMLPLLRGYDALRKSRTVRAFIRGLTSASVGLIFAAAIGIGLRSLTGWMAVVTFLITLGLITLARLGPIPSLFLAGAAGVALKLLAPERIF